MRDKLIHGYTTVNLLIVWNTLQDDLPALRQKVEVVLARESEAKR